MAEVSLRSFEGENPRTMAWILSDLVAGENGRQGGQILTSGGSAADVNAIYGHGIETAQQRIEHIQAQKLGEMSIEGSRILDSLGMTIGALTVEGGFRLFRKRGVLPAQLPFGYERLPRAYYEIVAFSVGQFDPSGERLAAGIRQVLDKLAADRDKGLFAWTLIPYHTNGKMLPEDYARQREVDDQLHNIPAMAGMQLVEINYFGVGPTIRNSTWPLGQKAVLYANTGSEDGGGGNGLAVLRGKRAAKDLEWKPPEENP